MSKLVWDKTGTRTYETGVSKGVLFPIQTDGTYSKGVAWSGLTKVSESPSGAEPTAYYADNIKYLNLLSAEDYGATIEAYMYPDEWAECDGSAELATGVSIRQQSRKMFGLCYRTEIGNDVEGTDYGYKLHLIYNCLAAPTDEDHETINDSPEPGTFSWEISTTPVEVTDHKPTACVVIDSTKADATKLGALEDILYGTAETEARLPFPDEIATLMAASV